jgi:hypothetical protein
MPSLEQIIRPFVVDPTTPPVPYITTLNDPPPDLVRLNIGIGGTSPSSLSPNVAPIVPPKPTTAPPPTKPPAIQYKTLSSSESVSVTYYMTGVVKEKTADDQGYDPFGKGGTFF